MAKYGVAIQFTDSGQESVVPFIYLESLYVYYSRGIMDMEDCIGEIINSREQFLKQHEGSEKIPLNVMEWEYARHNVYPVLVSRKNNKEFLKDLVTTGLLDLAVIYIIRGKSTDGRFTSIKINNYLLDIYGISKEELHIQALSNAKEDGYKFYEFTGVIGTLIKNGLYADSIKETGCITNGPMYLMTNTAMFYGTAGILDSQWLHEKTGGTSCYIIPSSVHELLLIPDNGDTSQEELDKMVLEVNSTALADDEKLSDHCYYYDAVAGETRTRK